MAPCRDIWGDCRVVLRPPIRRISSFEIGAPEERCGHGVKRDTPLRTHDDSHIS